MTLCRGNFYCPCCPKAEKYAGDLAAHMEERQHPSDALVGCPECRDRLAHVVIEGHYYQ